MLDRGRRRFLHHSLTLAGLSLLTGCSRLPVQTPARTLKRVGFLGVSLQPFHEAFFQAFRDLGYADGHNVSIERRYPEPISRLPDLAAELVQRPVDLLIAAGTTPTLKRVTTTVPIVTIQTDTVESGYAASLARPAGNVTGINLQSADLATKRLELLKQAVPAASQIAMLASGDGTVTQVRALEAVASSLGVTLHHYDIRSVDGFGAAFAAARADRAEAILALDQPLLTAQRAQIIAFAAEHRLPAIYAQQAFAVDGGLMTYGPNYADMFRRLAVFADKVLRGTPPGEIPMEQPTAFDFAVNLKTAQTHGIALSQSTLAQATEVIP